MQLLKIKFISFVMIFLFLSPFIILLVNLKINNNIHLDLDSFFIAFTNSIFQATVSVIITLCFGFLGGIGLASLENSHKHVINKFVILPLFMPPIFLVLVLSQGYSFLSQSFLGFWPIIIVNYFINMGLTSVLISQYIKTDAVPFLKMAYIEGASNLSLLWQSVLLLRRHLFFISIFLFSIFFTSFTVPVLVGGLRNQTIEVLIFDLIRLDSNYLFATLLCLFEILIIFTFSLLNKNQVYEHQSMMELKFLNLKFLSFIPIIVPIILFTTYILSLTISIKNLLLGAFSFQFILKPLLGSFFVGTCVGLILYVLFLVTAALYSEKFLHRFFLIYVAPSSAITGFSLLLIPPFSDWGVVYKITFGLVIMLFPILYKIRAQATLEKIAQQIKMAKLLGAGSFQVFGQIIVPQVSKPFAQLAGLGAFWAVGDFGVTAFLSTSESTLSIVVKNLLNSYQLDLGIFVSLVMIACGFVCYSLISGMSYVSNKIFSI
jgi:thiamine transport system permease protein